MSAPKKIKQSLYAQKDIFGNLAWPGAKKGGRRSSS
jgi:hypothetical protein